MGESYGRSALTMISWDQRMSWAGQMAFQPNQTLRHMLPRKWRILNTASRTLWVWTRKCCWWNYTTENARHGKWAHSSMIHACAPWLIRTGTVKVFTDGLVAYSVLATEGRSSRISHSSRVFSQLLQSARFKQLHLLMKINSLMFSAFYHCWRLWCDIHDFDLIVFFFCCRFCIKRTI